MTQEKLNSFKELAESLNKITQDAFIIYEEQVDRIYRNKITDNKEIERVIDDLLDFCHDDKILLLFKRICRYYYKINPSATFEYVNVYRNLWDEESLE